MLSKLYHRYILGSIYRLKTVFAYMKQGWNTYNWDYDYLLNDIVFKLELMKKQFQTDGIMTDEDVMEIVNQINEIINLIKKSQDTEQYWSVGAMRDLNFSIRSPEDYHKRVMEVNAKMAEDWKKIFDLLAAYLPRFWD